MYHGKCLQVGRGEVSLTAASITAEVKQGHQDGTGTDISLFVCKCMWRAEDSFVGSVLLALALVILCFKHRMKSEGDQTQHLSSTLKLSQRQEDVCR